MMYVGNTVAALLLAFTSAERKIWNGDVKATAFHLSASNTGSVTVHCTTPQNVHTSDGGRILFEGYMPWFLLDNELTETSITKIQMSEYLQYFQFYCIDTLVSGRHNVIRVCDIVAGTKIS